MYMEYNPKIMLAIFEKFIANATPFNAPDRQIYNVHHHFPNLIGLGTDLIRWHVAVFINEFTLNEDCLQTEFVRNKFAYTTGYELLNWSGQKLYQELKNSVNNQEQ